MVQYLREELGSDYLPPDPTLLLKQREIHNFFQAPIGLEKLLFLGFFICLDSFLFVFTFLPPRVFLGTLRLVWALFTGRPVKATSKYDLMRGAILLGSCWVLAHIDISMAYHYIRGQAVFKLYVIFNLLEVVDKLCCAFGQDIFDALFSRVNASTRASSTLHSIFFLFPHFLIAAAYNALHSLVLLYQMITLNVAINSGSSSLITLLVSNQFVELKSAAFKKYSRENLFQISCSDIVERFQVFIFIFAVVGHNCSDLEWDVSIKWLSSMGYMLLAVYLSECLVDWVKHCFVCKFNSLPYPLYTRFRSILAADFIAGGLRLDNNYAVSQRVGFISLPLACLVGRIFSQIFPWGTWWSAASLLLLWLCLAVCKWLLRIQLIAACLRISQEVPPASEEEEERSAKEEEAELLALSAVQRYQMCAGKIPT